MYLLFILKTGLIKESVTLHYVDCPSTRNENFLKFCLINNVKESSKEHKLSLNFITSISNTMSVYKNTNSRKIKSFDQSINWEAGLQIWFVKSLYSALPVSVHYKYFFLLINSF